MNLPVFDLHCDTALALLGENISDIGSLRKNSGMIDLERAGTLAGYAQCFACFTTPDMLKWYGKTPLAMFEMEMAAILSQIEKNSDRIALAYSPEDIIANSNEGRMSAILTIEGAAGFDYDPALLEDLYKIGFRMTTLGWNESSPLCGSHITGEGLSEKGKEYVRQAQSLHMLVDVSHISDKAFWDIIRITEAPIVASHSNSRAVCDSSRNLTDEMFMEICRTDGVVGLNLYSEFIGGKKDISTAAEHILHFLSLDTSGKHIALGGDLDGCETLADGFSGVQDYPRLAQQLKDSGVPENTIRDIFWNNALGVMQRAVCNDKK